MRRSLSLTASLLAAFVATACASAGAAPGLAAQQYRAPAEATTDTVFHGLDTRPIGPPGTSGRVAALAVNPTDLREIWVGAATGGLWRSMDGGHTWSPVMDVIVMSWKFMKVDRSPWSLEQSHGVGSGWISCGPHMSDDDQPSMARPLRAVHHPPSC